MKKSALYLVLLCFLSSTTSQSKMKYCPIKKKEIVKKVQSAPLEMEPNPYSDLCDSLCNPTKWSLQARGAAFVPLAGQLKDIYGNGWGAIEFEMSSIARRSVLAECDQVLVWANVSWAFKKGATEGFGYYTKLNLVPLSMGFSYQLNLMPNLDFYLGAAPTVSFLRIENFDGFSTTHVNPNAFGVTTKTGFRTTFRTHFFFDFFGDYFYTNFNKQCDSIQNLKGKFSGFFVGLGFGGKW